MVCLDFAVLNLVCGLIVCVIKLSCRSCLTEVGFDNGFRRIEVSGMSCRKPAEDWLLGGVDLTQEFRWLVYRLYLAGDSGKASGIVFVFTVAYALRVCGCDCVRWRRVHV